MSARTVYFLLVLFFTTVWKISAQPVQKFTISGYVREDPSQELLIGVNIYCPQLATGTVTNNYGFYSLTIPQTDSLMLVASFVGYLPDTVMLNVNEPKDLNFFLKAGIELGEVKITAMQNKKLSEEATMSRISIPVSQIKEIPGLLGEKDVLKVLQLMPGVQKGMEGSSGFYVRGGGPDQNLIILDDAIVYNVSHLFGFFSLFNGDALKSVELTKGGFPARFGGRLSSVLEMNMKEGNKQEWHAEGGIGIVSSRLTVEGPLKKNKSSVLISARRTYIDLLLAPLMKSDEKSGYYFYDLNAKVNYDFGRHNKLYLSGYLGRDQFYVKNNSSGSKEKGAFYWGNVTGTFRWNHLFNDKLFSNTSLIYSRFKFGIYEKYNFVSENKNYYAEYYSGIRDFSVKYDLDYLPSPQHWIKSGVIATYHVYEPHAYIDEDYTNQHYERNFQSTSGTETAIYIEDTYMPFSFLKVNAGIRATMFLTGKKNYWNPEPRISAAWRLNNDIALKASYASMNQYIHLLSNTGIDLPTDLWVPATNRIKPQHSGQVAMGIVKDFTAKNFSVSLEGYYKEMKHIIGYKEGASFASFDDPQTGRELSWEDNVTPGKGWSRGIELLIQRKSGRLSGWIGYTLSWTQLQFDSLNFGRKFYARYDRRHDVSIVCIYKLFPDVTFSATWVYGTGNAITLPVSQYFINDPSQTGYSYAGYTNSPFSWQKGVKDYSGKNNFRMAAYHRLDVGIQFHKRKNNHEHSWELSAYNVYSRHNPFYYYTEQTIKDGKEYNQLKQISLFPLIPSVTYSFKF